MRNTSKSLILASALLLSSTAIAQVWLPVQGEVGGVEFPARDRSYLTKGDKGQFVNIDNLRHMKKGLSKQEVRKLLGAPHFSEGLGGVSAWNYIFHFRTGQGDAFITCQYQVVYNKEPKYNVGSMHWDMPDCMTLANTREAPPVAPPAPPAVQRFELSADALFHFNKSGVDEILPKGRAEVEAIAPQLRNATSVQVIGHTDRLGSDEANFALGQRRAETVAQLLAQHGVPAQVITATSRGESEQVVPCNESMPRSALIGCLQPNRRVEIIANGEQVTR